MRSATLPSVALFLFLAGLAAACATSTDVPVDDGGISGAKDGGKDAAKYDGAGGDAGQVCVSTCGTDLDCQNTCPPVVNSGINCCDQGTNKCFPVADTVCPAPVDQDAGQPPPY